MQLKMVIELDGNFVDKKRKHIIIDSKAKLQTCLRDNLYYAFERLYHHPIIVLRTKLVGEVDGFEINSAPSQRGLPIYVADNYKSNGNTNIVYNPLRGTDTSISKGYVIMNRDGDQLYPPLSENIHSEIEKFSNRAFNTVYKVEKTR